MISHIQICPNSYSTSTTKQKPPRGFHIHISSGEKKKSGKKNETDSGLPPRNSSTGKTKRNSRRRIVREKIYKRRVRSMVTCSTAASVLGERASGEAVVVVLAQKWFWWNQWSSRKAGGVGGGAGAYCVGRWWWWWWVMVGGGECWKEPRWRISEVKAFREAALSLLWAFWWPPRAWEV